MVIFAVATTISAWFNDFGSDVDRTWTRFYMFWAHICNLSFVSIFYSRRKVQTSIEERVVKRTEELNHFRQEAIANTLRKAELLTYLSNEIRTPMYALRGMVESIASTPDLPPEVDQYVDNLRVSNTFILDLVSNVLDVKKQEENKFTVNVASTDVVSLLRTFIAHTKTQCSSHNIRFLFPTDFSHFPRHVDCDGVKVQQILYNLTSNALKYTPEGGQITFDASYSTDILHLSIADDGVGMTPETLQHLFEPYAQATSAKAGTGLGLAICKTFTEMMHGTIEVISAVGEGSKFTVDIPAAASR